MKCTNLVAFAASVRLSRAVSTSFATVSTVELLERWPSSDIPKLSDLTSVSETTDLMDAAVYQRLHPREYQRRFLSAAVRSDGRSPAAARRATLTMGSLSSAVGSAMVKLGRTTAVAGLSATLVEPPAVDPAVGSIAVNVQVLSMAGPGGKSGAERGADAACLAEFIRENVVRHVDCPSLCEEGVLVWALSLTVYCVDHDGNVEDAMLLAATAALRDARLPDVRLVDDLPDGDADCIGGVGVAEEKVLAVVSGERTTSLLLNDYCLAVSFVLFDEHLLLDPTREEEAVADARITLVLRPSGELRAVHKPGGAPISVTSIGKCLELAKPKLAAMVGMF
jgi:exosome complex component RRP43